MKIFVLAIAMVAAAPAFSLQAVECPNIIVDSVADSGPGTLRQAILEANGCPGTNTILFNIPGAGLHTIMPVGGLPVVTGPVVIDGWSQPQFAGSPLIEINGLLSPTSFGLNIQSSNCVVRGLAINRFAAPGGNGFGIGLFTANARSNWIYACRLGCDSEGAVARPNGQGGIWIGSGPTANLIGSDLNGVDDPAEANLISGNNGHGILLQGGGNIVAGNRIGTDASGAAKLPNTQHGIYLNNSGRNVIVGNLISGNGRARFDGGIGIFMRFPNAAHNVVIGNRIGTTASGDAPLGNTTSGIALSSGAHDNRIGTDGDGLNDARERNLISGNGNDGITVGFVFGDAPVLNTVIAGNFIGTDDQGQFSIPNFDSAVYVISGEGHRIGTDGNGTGDEAERNILSGNRRVGVTLDGSPGPTRHITVAGNFIGIDATGGAALGNPVTGVLIRNGASENVIGGTNPATANRIAFNGVGVTVTGGEHNRILGNSIHAQTGIGIDLGGDGPTANDAGDADTGPNGRQNFPLLNAVNGGGVIRGTFSGKPGSAFVLQFFANMSCDPSGFGEGRSFLGSMDVITSVAGMADFEFPYTPIAGSISLSATATSSAGDTSEFSPCALGNTRPVAQAQAVNTLEDTDVVITLGGSDADNDPLTAKIVALPTRGALYQFVGGGRGTRLQTSPVVVTDAQRRVVFAPPFQGSGTTAFEFVVNDGVQDSETALVSLDITPVNDPPSFTPGPDVTMREDSSELSLNWATMISTGPENESEQSRQFLVANDQPSLFAVQPRINAFGVLTFTPAPNLFGQALVTVRLQDSGGISDGGNNLSEPATFRITILPVNDAPVFNAGAAQSVREDAGLQIVPQWATGISAGPANEMQSVTFLVSNDQGALFLVQPSVDPDGTLRYEAVADANGVANVVVVLRDNGGVENAGVDMSAPQSFTITVRPVNDQPTFTGGPDQDVAEDSGPMSVPGWASAIDVGPPNENGQTASFEVSSDRPGLFAAGPAISSDGTLSFTPAPQANGTAVVTVHLRDNGGVTDGGVDLSPPYTFRIVIRSINDQPSFVSGPDIVLAEDAGAQSFAGWAQNIQAGPADEAGQVVQFSTSTTNPSLFSTPPKVSSNGTLAFTPAANAHGVALVTIVLADDGGTGGGGGDRSTGHTLRITVTSVNDCPVPRNQQLQTGEEQPLAVTLSAQDVEGDPLTFTLTQPPAHGTLSGVPPNLTYTPIAQYCGPDQIGFTASDGGTACSPGQGRVDINVTCSNDCPTAIARVVPPAMPDDSETNYTVIAANNATAVVMFDGSASWDPEGDPLTYAWAEVPWAGAGAACADPDHKRCSSNPGGCGRCHGEVTQLTLRYAGEQRSTVTIRQKDGDLVFHRSVAPDGEFTITGGDHDGGFGDKIIVYVNGVENAELTTSCARPVGPGQVFGDFVILEGRSEHGRLLCARAGLPLTAARPFAMGPVAEDELCVGRHAITLMVSDGQCVAGTTIFVDVITPAQAIEACIALVEAANIDRKDKRPLTDTLKKTAQQFERGNFRQAVKMLEAFIKKVESAVEKRRIPTHIADDFLECVGSVIAQLPPSYCSRDH